MKIREWLFGKDRDDTGFNGRQIDDADVGRRVKAALRSPTPPVKAAERVLAELRESRVTRPDRVTPETVRKPARWRVAAVSAAAGLVLGVVLAWIAFGPASKGVSGSPLDIRIMALEGTVLVQHRGSATWRELSAGADIYAGDSLLSSASSRLTLGLMDESTLLLEPNSDLEVKHYDGGAEFILDQGELVADLRSPHPPFMIRTPQGAVEALGTKFRVAVK